MGRGTHILMTGATGFVGRHLVFRLLAHTDVRLTLVVRAKSPREASERVDACLREVARESGVVLDAGRKAAVRVVVGDVRSPGCGLTRALAEELGVDEVWHLAASLSFAERSAAETYEH